MKSINRKHLRAVALAFILSGLCPLSFAAASETASAPGILNAEAVQQQQGLAAALRAVVNRHPATKGKQAEVNARQFAIDGAKAGRYPSVSIEANNLYDDFDQGTVSASQPLWAFGKIDTAIDLAKANYSADRLELLQVQRELIEQTAVAYATVEGIKQRAKVARTNITEHEQLYQQIKRRRAGQLASETDERLAHSRIIQARVQYIRIEGELQVALTELQALTQIEINTELPVDRLLTDLPSCSDLINIALKNSAAVALKRELQKVAELNIKNEKAASLPTVYARVDHDFMDVSSDRTRAGFVIQGNMDGLGFASYSRIKGAAARKNAASEDINIVINDLRRRINTLMANRNVQMALIDSQSEAVGVVEATMASFLRQYKTGRKTWLDVLNIQRELTELRFQLAQIKSDWLILSLRVTAMTGGLDQLAGIKSL